MALMAGAMMVGLVLILLGLVLMLVGLVLIWKTGDACTMRCFG